MKTLIFQKKLENYKLLNEQEEILLCKEESINEIKSKKENKEEEIKIKELYKGEDNNSVYYINKKELKKKYIMKIDLNEDNENLNAIFDNKNEKEMEKLYEEIQLKHPRKIIDGKIQRYPFFSWSGFFCCNKSDYISLGQTYITYFNTIKLLIIFFLIIALVNSPLMTFFSKFESVYKTTDDDDKLLKTTLGNTITRYFKGDTIFFERNSNNWININLDCGEDLIEEFVAIQRCYDLYYRFIAIDNSKEFIELSCGPSQNIIYNLSDEASYLPYQIISELNFYELEYFNCTNKNHCTIQYYTQYYGEYKPFYYESIYNISSVYDNIKDLFQYSCKKRSYDTNNKQIEQNEIEKIKTAIILITFITLVSLIIFYSFYKKSISRDKKEFHKNKIFINDYTLVLHSLRINSANYNEEISDLVSFLNKLVKKYKHLFISYHENYKEITDLNIFDINISNVNDKKIKNFEQMKSLKNKIEDIKSGNDSIKNKVKTNLRELYLSMHNIAVNLSDKEKTKKDEELKEDNIIKDKEEPEPPEEEEGYDLEKEIKIGNVNTKINKNLNNITIDISELHKEYNLKKYSDIYITFRNQLIPKLIYDLYNKGKIIRFFYYIFCQSKKLEIYYYKEQWLNFEIAKENPSDIIWENCYITPIKKFGRRALSILLSFLFIAIILVIMFFTKSEENSSYILYGLILPQIIMLCSPYVLKLFIKFEKYGSKSKEMFSTISKNYWLNFLVYLTVYFQRNNFTIFSYISPNYYYIFNKNIILNVLYSIVTSQLSPLFFYLLNILKRFSDSKYNNGKTTEVTTKIKYEKIYLGPEFPFEERYSKILVILSLCLFYGSYCPVIYFFFVCFLVVTFLVDKFLMIYYYKKPPLYGNILSVKIQNYLFFCVLLYVYGLFYNLSNPYLFANDSLKFNLQRGIFNFQNAGEIIEFVYYILNPFTLVYMIICLIVKMKDTTFLYYNFNSNILLVHFFLFIFVFLNPMSFLKKKLTPKSKFLSFMNISPVEIGSIYSIEELEKYYEIKKIQLINLINEYENNGKSVDNYSHLINNYMFVINYIKQNIDNKMKKQQQSIISTSSDNIDEEFSPLKRDDTITINRLHLTGDISYNQSFIPKYELYNNFSLIKNL